MNNEQGGPRAKWGGGGGGGGGGGREGERCIRRLVGRPEGNRPMRRPRRRC